MRIVFLVGLVACSANAPPPAAPESSSPTSSLVEKAQPHSETDARFVAAVRVAGERYRTWARVDQAPKIAPMMCDIPRGPKPWGSEGRVHVSAAEDAPHGKKLYYLWADTRDRTAYTQLTGSTAPLPAGFTIVKEAFAAVPAGDAETQPPSGPPPLHAKLRVDGNWLTTGAAAGLYVMTKVDATDGTDAGWVYGTILPDGTVTSAGRVTSCMGCHDAAPHERLFGLPALSDETHGY